VKLGFTGPYAGTQHQFMIIDQRRLAIPPNPEYSAGQLRVLLREVESVLGRTVSIDEWAGLRPEDEWLIENKDAINEKLERAMAQLNRGEGIPCRRLRGRLEERKAAWLAEQKR
jgi:hypothetical protein